MGDVVDIKDFKWELRKRKIKEKLSQAWEFVKEHPTESMAAATAGIGGVMGLIKRHDRHQMIKEQQRLKDEYIYDRSLGRYIKMRKKPSTSEALEIERRKHNGEPLGQILADMRLL